MFNVQFPGLGLDFTVNRIAFTAFGIPVYWYGIILTTGLLVAAIIGIRLSKKFDIDEDKLLDVILIGGVCAIICARIYYVVFAPFKYESIWDMINIRDGGIAIYGAVIGAFIFGGLACKWRKLDVLNVADITAMCFLIGQAIGRWGNFVNQEAFGTNTTAPWGMISEGTISYLKSVQGTLAAQGIVVDPYSPVHPTFLYESIWCLVGFILLMLYFNRRKFKGEMLCLYAIWYGTGRYFIEGLRTDSLETSGGIRTSQLVALGSIGIALAVIAYNYYKIKKGDVVVEQNLSESTEDLLTVEEAVLLQDASLVQPNITEDIIELAQDGECVKEVPAEKQDKGN